MAEAHRPVPIVEKDWYFLGGQIQQGSSVHVNKVGTFGVVSASCYWSRVSSAFGRLAQYLVEHTANAWHVLVADNFHIEASGLGYREAFFNFFPVCAICKVPLSWRQATTIDTVVWVGFELLHRCHQLGISKRRAEWLIKWTRDVSSKTYMDMTYYKQDSEESCTSLARQSTRGPSSDLCTSSSRIHPQGTTRRLSSVGFIVRYHAWDPQLKQFFHEQREQQTTILPGRRENERN